jgi:hypothetical protein
VPTAAEVSTGASIAGGLVIAVVLAALHLAAPRIRKLPGIPESATGSFAGGLAVAYVFLHLLPELVEGNQAIGAVLDDVVHETPLLDLAIFAVALAGFTLFYGLERRAQRGGGGAGLFRLHMGSFVVYNALITYTMPLRLRTGVGFAVLFTIAMGLHFVLTDRGLEEHYPQRFERVGRPVLAAGLILGWAVVAVVAPTSAVVVALLTAFLGGSVLLNVFKEELPSDRRSSFGWFAVGLLVYGGLLTLITGLG